MRAITLVMCATALLLMSCAVDSVPLSAMPSATQPSSEAEDVTTGSPSVAPPTAPQYVLWQAYQRPSAGGIEQTNRIQEVPPVGPPVGRPMGQVLRFELRPEDRQTGSGYAANRVEVFSRHAESDDVPADRIPLARSGGTGSPSSYPRTSSPQGTTSGSPSPSGRAQRAGLRRWRSR
jgi:hypothetical protein